VKLQTDLVKSVLRLQMPSRNQAASSLTLNGGVPLSQLHIGSSMPAVNLDEAREGSIWKRLELDHAAMVNVSIVLLLVAGNQTQDIPT